MSSGAHRVWVYVPTIDTLRDMVNRLRTVAGTDPQPRLFVTEELSAPTSLAGLAAHYIGGERAVQALLETTPELRDLPAGGRIIMGGGCFIERVQ